MLLRVSQAGGYAGMDGGEWQRLCLNVLRVKYGDDLVPVPDVHHGDAGLEAFTLGGMAFQSYSPREPLGVKQRYEKHRNKMTEDIGKFIANKQTLAGMFGA